jgi:hypothetical protein
MENIVNYDQYFQVVAEIWGAFNEGRISGQKRDQLLSPYRKQLESLVPSPFARGPNTFA